MSHDVLSDRLQPIVACENVVLPAQLLSKSRFLFRVESAASMTE